MTEKEWLEASDPQLLLHHLPPTATQRKVRLFACACCRHVWSWPPEAAGQIVARVAEQYANGLASRDEWKAIRQRWRGVGDPHLGSGQGVYAAGVIVTMTLNRARALTISPWKLDAMRRGVVPWPEEPLQRHGDEGQALCRLLRQIAGTSVPPCPDSYPWSAAVSELAIALYNGADCGFALHDALIEDGHSELAEHLVNEQSYPKGGWVVNLILGRG